MIAKGWQEIGRERVFLLSVMLCGLVVLKVDTCIGDGYMNSMNSILA